MLTVLSTTFDELRVLDKCRVFDKCTMFDRCKAFDKCRAFGKCGFFEKCTVFDKWSVIDKRVAFDKSTVFDECRDFDKENVKYTTSLVRSELIAFSSIFYYLCYLLHAMVELHIVMQNKTRNIPPCNWSFWQGTYYYVMFTFRIGEVVNSFLVHSIDWRIYHSLDSTYCCLCNRKLFAYFYHLGW